MSVWRCSLRGLRLREVLRIYRKLQLPEDPEAAAAEFLTLLGKHGLVEFLPDDAFIDLPPEDTIAKEDDLCADK